MAKIQDYNLYLTDFFSLLDIYLIKDLETLVKEIPARENGGGVGYPALQSILSAMELLGLMLSGDKQSTAFKFYWDNYLAQMFSQYAKKGLSDIFIHVMRNGTAHLFLVKTGVSVSKNGNNHLIPLSAKGQIFLNVDLVVLHSHFLNTYEEIKKGLLKNPLPPSVQAGCDLFQAQMVEADNKVQDFIKANYPMGPAGSTTIVGSGVSGPTRFMGTTTSTSGTTNPLKGTITPPPRIQP